MCMQANESESCKLNATVAALGKRVDAIETRLDAVEATTRDGFASVNANIETLSQQITNMDARIVEEKTKWGEVLRKVVLWTVGTVLTLALAAAGINALPDIVKAFR